MLTKKRFCLKILLIACAVFAIGAFIFHKVEDRKAYAQVKDKWYESKDVDFNDGLFRETLLSGPGTAADIRLAPFNQWYNDFWEFRRAVIVDNRLNPDSLQSYQVRFEIPYWTGMNSNFADIRFTSQNGVTILDHWKEQFTASSAAVFWVNIPNIPESDLLKVYVYYGNLGTGDTSDGDNVFVFFDDFNDNSLDTTKWTIIGTGISEQDGLMQLLITNATQQPSLSTAITRIIPNQFILDRQVKLFAANDFFYGSMLISSLSGVLGTVRYSYDFNPADGILYTNRDSFYLARSSDDSSSPLSPFWNNVWFNETVIYNGETGDVTYFRDNNVTKETISYVLNETANDVRFMFTPQGSGEGHFHEMDNVRIRRYTKYEPTVEVGVEQIESVGAYVTKGTYASSVFDTLASASTIDSITWNTTLPSGTAITMEIRASDNQFEADDYLDPPWTTVINGSDPPLAGRFIQYRATLSGTGIFSPELEDVLVNYTITSPISPSITVAEGGNIPGPTNEQSSASDLEMIQVSLTAGASEPILISSLTFTASGTGDDVAEIIPDSVRLYVDTDDNGILNSSGDTLLGTGTYSADNGTITFSGLSLVINQSEETNILLVYNLSGTATFGDTFIANIMTRQDITATGVISEEPSTILGTFPLNGNAKTISTSGSFSVALGAATPESQTVSNAAQGVSVLQLSFQTGSVEPITVSGLKITASGTGDDGQDIKPNGCWLILDSNGNGAVDAQEYQIGFNQSFTADDGSVTFTLTEQLPINGDAKWLLLYTYSGNGTGGNTFEASIISPTDITATGVNSASSITPTGAFPITSATITLSSQLTLPNPTEPARVKGSQATYCVIKAMAPDKGPAAILLLSILAFMGIALSIYSKNRK